MHAASAPAHGATAELNVSDASGFVRAQVKGIPCTQFKYTSTSSDYDTQGHQLVGEAEEELPPSAGTHICRRT